MLKALTSLRFFAALLVFFVHDMPLRGISTAFSFGYAGVSFFFVLSGFILTYTYHRDFASVPRRETIRSFYVARLARIYPLHLVATALMLVTVVLVGGRYWTAVAQPTRVAELVAQVTMTQSWFRDETMHFGLNAPAWSISVEAFFYLLFPVLAYMLIRATGEGRIVPLLLALGLWVGQTLLLLPLHVAWDYWPFYILPPARLGDFIVGMLVALAFLRRTTTPLSRNNATRLELGLLAAAVSAIAWSPAVPVALRFSTFFLPIWAGLIYVFARQRGDVSRSLTHPVFVRLGEASYAFYLVHYTVVQLITQVTGWSRPLTYSLLAFGVSLGASLILYSYVETPLRRRIRHAFRGPSVPRTLASEVAA